MNSRTTEPLIAVDTPTSSAPRSPAAPGLVLGLLLLAAVAATFIDVPLSRALVEHHALRPLHKLLAAFEPFGQPAAVLVTAAAIALCDPRRRMDAWRLPAAALGAGLAADLVKLCVARARPHHADLAGTALDTFRGAFPLLGQGSAGQSFPSAHTATAVGFALALGTMFPAACGLWLALAGLVAAQRIEAGAHYLSDTLCGAAVGYAVWLLAGRTRRSD